MKIIVAHPGQQHSFRVASALKEKNNLYKYITAVYDKPRNFPMKLAHLLVRGKDVDKISKRKNRDLNDQDVVTYYTFLSLVVIVLSRFSRTKKLSFWLDRKIADAFGIKVAKYAIRHKVDAIICFSMNETACFRYLEQKGSKIVRIVDCANTPVEHMVSIYENDIGLKHIMQEVPIFWDKKELHKQNLGMKYTQSFIAPSNFVKKGLIFCGVEEKRIEVIPYGTDFKVKNKAQDIPEKIKFIYVGQVTYRKGIHHLLKAFSELQLDEAELDIVGEVQQNSDIYEKYKSFDNIKFYGTVPHEKVRELLLKSNVFLFDSLADSFSLAVLEAMSCGLPVICSVNAGASDLIKEEFNGFIVAPNKIVELKERIMFFVNNKEIIPQYSKNSLEIAKIYTWEKYNENLSDYVDRKLGGKWCK